MVILFCAYFILFVSCTEQSEGNISSLTGSGIQDCDCAGCGIEDLLEVV